MIYLVISEQEVTVPVYQPPKQSLREFLAEQAPQLLPALRQGPKVSVPAPSPRRKANPQAKHSRPPKYIEEMDYLKDNPLMYSPKKPQGRNKVNKVNPDHMTLSLFYT